jgi:hypothetical protein
VDGICACSLLTLALRRFGVNAQPHTPLRAEGYGLNCDAVRELAQTYRVLVTVDLGITNHEEVRLAQSLGMRVIFLTHHPLLYGSEPDKGTGRAEMAALLKQYDARLIISGHMHSEAVLQEENLSMSSLYETYRKLVSDDVYYDNTRWLMTKYEKEGDLNALLQYL